MSLTEVAQAADIPPGAMKAVAVQGKEVLLANVDGKFYAIGGKCTHAGGDLSKGKLEGKVVTCPRHGSRFDVTTGEALSGPKVGPLRLKTKNETSYKVMVEGNSVKIDVE